MSTYSQTPTDTQPPETFQNWWDRGYGPSIIPVVFGEKRPSISAWQNHAATIGHIQTWDSTPHNIGLQTSKFPCLDIDCKDRPAVEAIHKAVLDTCGNFPTPMRLRGAPRCAILFKLSLNCPPMSKMTRTYRHVISGEKFTIEMLGDGQQVVIDGKHPSKEWYSWCDHRPTAHALPHMNEPRRANLFQNIDDALLALAYLPSSRAGPTPGRKAKTSKYGPLPPKGQEHLVIDILKVLPNECDYDGWIEVGMAAKAAAGKDPDLDTDYMMAWTEWSNKSPQSEISKSNNATWSTFDPDGSVGYGTLIYLLKQTKGNDKLKSRIDRARIPLARDEFSEVPETDPFVEAKAADMFAQFNASRPQWLKDMDDKIAMLSTGDNVLFIMDPNTKRDKPELKRKVAAETLTGNWGTIANAKNPKLKGIPKLKAWIDHPMRKPEYKGLDIYVDKKAPPDIYNMWNGWPYENDAPGDWALLNDHINEVVCGSDPVLQDYVYNWMAHGVQHAMTPSRVALMLQGEQGTGKGVAVQAYLRLFGRAHTLHLGSSQMITGTFNGLLKNKLVVFADEAFFADDPRQSRLLKTIITEETIVFNEKFEPAYEAPNRMNLIMATNDIHAVQLDTGDRRYAVIEVENSRANDHVYFNILFAMLDIRGAMAGFFHFLRQRDISGFVPSDLPPTHARVNQMLMSLTPVKKWWYEALNSGGACPGSYPVDADWSNPVVQVRDHAYSHFQHWARQGNVKHVPDAQRFGIELSQISARIGGPTTAQGAHATRVSSLVDCCNKFEKVCRCKLDWV